MAADSNHRPGPAAFEMIASRVEALRVLHEVAVDLARLREEELAFGRRLEEMTARLDDTLGRIHGKPREFSVRIGVRS